MRLSQRDKWSIALVLGLAATAIGLVFGVVLLLPDQAAGRWLPPVPPTPTPAPSRSVGRIVFAFYDANQQQSDIGLIFADGSGRTNLTRTPQQSEGSPAWSPDATQIAFTVYHKGQESIRESIMLMQADGSQVRTLRAFPDTVCELSWSPDGSQLAFRSPCDSAGYVYRMSSDGTQLTEIGRGWNPRWSPDGTELLFTLLSNSEGILFRASADSAISTRLTSFQPDHLYPPAWSPDSQYIVFADRIDKVLTLVRIKRDGSERIQLTHLSQDCVSPIWSPDGTTLVFPCLNDEDGPLSSRSNLATFYRIDTNGSSLTPLLQAPAGLPVGWSPDGSWLLIQRSEGGMEYIKTTFYLLRADGAAFIPLIEASEASWAPR